MSEEIEDSRSGFVEILSGKTGDDYRRLYDDIMLLAAGGQLPLGIVGDFSRLLRDFFACIKVEAVFREENKVLLVRTTSRKPVFSYSKKDEDVAIEDLVTTLNIEPFAREDWLKARIAAVSRETPGRGLIFHYPHTAHVEAGDDMGALQTYLFIPAAKTLCGIVVLTFDAVRDFDGRTTKTLRRLIATMGLSYTHNRSRFELRERVKELTCMYNIANLSIDPELDIRIFLQRVVELLPAAYLNPEITEARIVFDEEIFQTPGFVQSRRYQAAEIVLAGQRRGRVEVIYREPMPRLDEGPFLAEERRLLDSVVSEVATIIRHKESELARAKLQEQLRHSDRLATIGQLAAGVAHELNEPLTGILGFAELLKETHNMPRTAMSDVSRIESAALHAREVVRKLLTFARQVPPKQRVVNVNSVIREVESFFEGRCTQQGTRLEMELDDTLPDIFADESQIRQVVLNLMINALHAVEKDGRIRISTRLQNKDILISLQDDGPGIAEDIKDKIFLPFFTTKAVDKGTGMGLSVVDGIVKSHKGRIEVASGPSRGAIFKVFLPVEKRDI
jgi:signal transduction histidine kinase